MTEQPHCPKCGTQLPADAPAGLCPKCLVQAGLESEPPPHSMPAATMPSPAISGFEPLSVESLAGKFPQLEILELLGKGGMGAVYKARQRGLDRLVAVKVLPPEIGHDPAFAERFTREARALARLSHNHIVSVFDFGQSDGLFYIVMEYVDGVNLRQTIQTGKLTPAEALAIVPQICEALQFAHDEGIVHRDIKPENILIDKRGRVKIADFGLAKLMASGGRESPDAFLTATHQVMGTLRYMAPEQMLGTREVDHRADIYSLGVIFYELLTGELPMGKFAPPSKRVQVDVRLDEIVLRALEQDPEQRYQHASEVKTELDSIRTTPEPTAKPVAGRDPLDGFRDLARFSMTPNARYGKRVGIPMLILFGVWLASTITVHVLFGQKGNYQEGPILLIQGGGMILFIFVAVVMHLVFFVRERAAKAAERQTGASAAPLMPYQETFSQPRFSRFAIVGAVWALFGLLAVIPTLFFIALNRVWNGIALPTDMVHEQPPLPFLIFMMFLLAVGAGAPIGTTIFGALAIGHIKRSGGKIIGLPLAVTDVLFFPLLALAGIIAFLIGLIWMGVAPHTNAAALYSAASFGALVALGVCFFVARAMWRKIAGEKTETGPGSLTRGHDGRLPETQVRFVVSDTSDVPRQANFHFSTLGYQLIEQGPDLCVFERGNKWAGLWAMDIRRLHTILTVRTAPAADGGLWVSCNWSIRKLGSWIPKSDIALLEAEGLGLETVLNERTKSGPGSWPPAGRATPVIASEPRVSRFAIAGAVWALFGLLMIAPALLFNGWRPTPVPVATSGVTQLQIPWPVMLMGVMSILGATAPLGTTILGALAIGHIKRSGGRIIGLPLAVADVLFFPLLAVFAGIAVPLALALHSLLPLQLVVVALPSAVLALVVCLVIGNAVWRAVAGHPEAPAAKKTWRRHLPWVLAALILVLACGVGWIQQNSSPPASKVPTVPPLKTITSGYGVQFLVPAGTVAVFEIVTRKGNATAPVPSHCGYVMASQETPMDGTFLWSRMEEDIKAEDGSPIRRWQIEIRTAGGGGGQSSGHVLPEGLDSAVGASSIWLGDLEPNEERVYWGAAVDASNLPANGLIGLRVTVVPHGQNRSGTGISHTDWKTPPPSSTTRRKLDP